MITSTYFPASFGFSVQPHTLRAAGLLLIQMLHLSLGAVPITKFNYCFNYTTSPWWTFISGKLPVVIWLCTVKHLLPQAGGKDVVTDAKARVMQGKLLILWSLLFGDHLVLVLELPVLGWNWQREEVKLLAQLCQRSSTWLGVVKSCLDSGHRVVFETTQIQQ